MGDLTEQLSDLIGATGEPAGLVIAALALLLIVLGATLLIVTVFGKWARSVEQDGSSRLLPTLVEDVLDLDLQRVYRRALLLDRYVADSFDSLAEPTGTELGRRTRRYVVRLQARRFAARRARADQQKSGEPPKEEARLKEVSAVMERALDELPWGKSSSGAAAEAARMLEELGAQLEPICSNRTTAPRNTPAG